MSQMRTSIKIRAGYRPANFNDQYRRCRHCSRNNVRCKLLGFITNPDYTCREYKPKEQ